MDTIDRAFTKVRRADFMPTDVRGMASIDSAMPIGYGQTISQPTTVVMMLKWLDARPGDRVLDVGSGSGWTAALLSHIVGAKGEIYAVERIPELVEMGRVNCQNAGIKNAKFFLAGDEYGLPAEAPFDRILVSASANKLPNSLVDQLKPGGKMVIPVRNSIFEIHKNQADKDESTEHPGFVFVPLI